MPEKRQETQRLAAVIGWPVGHSLSPLIHSIWAAREGVRARYDAIAVDPSDEAFRKRINELRVEGYAGVNVTLPHKERALKIADAASDAARAIGAANMLTFGGAIRADNSDAAAVSDIIAALDVRPRSALVIGAGGSARAVLWALKAQEVGRVFIANRTLARAEEIAPIADAEVIAWTARNAALESADLIINATSLGMKGQPPLDLDHERLKPGAVVFDIVYAPLETPLLKAARLRGLKTVDGLEMLMRQAVPGYLAWLGNAAAVDDDLRKRLEAALKARAS
ncbi:MAG TPA: shikimate dehydrogenase [Parvularculaceae bacterium]|nr:shikimate dehydrogenase [Parvularculaceae bacterium]HNS85668.1 shikimate dehydrogenase [Parvularculaceae bacterium]